MAEETWFFSAIAQKSCCLASTEASRTPDRQWCSPDSTQLSGQPVVELGAEPCVQAIGDAHGARKRAFLDDPVEEFAFTFHDSGRPAGQALINH